MTQLRTSREHHLLKDALYKGGITDETLALLVSGSDNTVDQRKDSGVTLTGGSTWDDDFTKLPYSSRSFPSRVHSQSREMSRRDSVPASNPPIGSAPYPLGKHLSRTHFRAPGFQRQVSYGASSIPDDIGFDDDNDQHSVEDMQTGPPTYPNLSTGGEKRTLYFSGLSDRTTYSDLLSVIKGGKILSVSMRERTATVSFLNGAGEFLAWAKKNDIYLQSKRVQVSWATRQFNLNPHNATKITSGATRNLCIRGALAKGLSESQIREDMEHIHNLVIVSVTYSSAGDAFVSTNAVHNALFARTCMLSRSAYRGCQVEFYADECDVPLPVVEQKVKSMRGSIRANDIKPTKKNVLSNRFGLLDLDDGSDEENRTPSEEEISDDGVGIARAGVNLRFLNEGAD